MSRNSLRGDIHLTADPLGHGPAEVSEAGLMHKHLRLSYKEELVAVATVLGRDKKSAASRSQD